MSSLTQFQFFQSSKDRLRTGIQGVYPEQLVEIAANRAETRHGINETLTRPWLKHFFLMQLLRESNVQDEIITRDHNLIDIFKSTIPLPENSFTESSMSAWRMFLDTTFRESDVQWYQGIRKTMNNERFYNAIEQLELEMPESNVQRGLQFYDHTKSLRKIPRVAVKLFFALPGNEKEKLIEILRQAVRTNPHNVDVALLTYSFLKAWDRTPDFLELARTENRNDLEEWYFWVEGDMHSLGALKRDAGDHATAFYIYDRTIFPVAELKELSDWFLKESEFKSAYHFYYKAKEFETALDLLQNISVKEFAELTNMRRISKGEKPFDLSGDLSRFNAMYQEETETLRGFARIRAQETYKQVAVKARQHFDRETIETKYAFGELSDDEYHRLIRQIQERKQ